jgi:hypothetical protein
MRTEPALGSRGLSAISRRWKARLRRVSAIGELIQVVQSFLDACGAAEIGMLSRAGAPLECGSSDELKELVICLALPRAAAAAAGVPERFKRLFTFFTDAASRLGQLEFELRFATAQ